MKIFISGVAGFLGSHIADRMLQDGHEVVGCDNLIGGYVDNVPKDVTFHNYDLNNLDGLSDLIAECDIVYHTACTAYEGLSVFSPSLICQNTMQISVNLMTAAIQAGVGRFVHCSSMARYGTQEITPFREDMICKPQDPYGIAKYAAELMLKNLAEVHGIELVIAVPHNIVGARQKYDDPFRNVASIMINLMLQGRPPVIYGDGSQIRCFSDVRDDIDCLVELAFSEAVVGQTFNIGPDENEITINKLFEIISNKLQFNEEPIYMPGRPQEVKHATCSADKARKYLGYSTKYSTSESIDTMIDYIRDRGAKSFEYHLPLEIITDKTPATWKEKLF
ncbi:NAD-dependent epimerase/dehydratase family protein [Amylibacter sp.]|nr:NAD-dependent epimerase/dehydratase family protein [Amylibacter sp.]